MVAMEQGIAPHERSLGRGDEIEEERRLAFVGMTRAKEELYLCLARVRDFRGQTRCAVPSPFLTELPEDALENIDLSASAGGTAGAVDAWRGGRSDADAGWRDAGIVLRGTGQELAGAEYAEGMLVRHETYGQGRVTEVTGYGAMRKMKIRFAAAGERTFLVAKARLTILG